MKALFNGNILEQDSISIPVNDRGLLLADGLFETMRVQNGRVLFFDYHWVRLEKSAKQIYIPLPFLKQELLNNIAQLLQENQALNGKFSLRLTLTRGSSDKRGIDISEHCQPNYLLTCANYDDMPKQGISLIISEIHRCETSPFIKLKTLNKLENVIARYHAQKMGFDDALFLNSSAMITETTVANLFIVINDRLITPPLDDGLMEGVTRGVIFSLAEKFNFQVFEMSISCNDLLRATEIIVTNSLVGIQKVKIIKNYFTSKSNSWFDRLSSFYNQIG